MVLAVPNGSAWEAYPRLGAMFLLSLKKFVGSHLFLISASRSRCLPYACWIRSPVSSSVRKFTYVPPVEKGRRSRQVARAHSIFIASSLDCSQEVLTLNTEAASRFPI